ncbi:MAG: PhoH family protein [Bacteroidales bacterium]|nr:PhoH family protein [Bacteroidales bacterium]
MSEKIIVIEGIDPVDLFGVNNSRLEKLKSYFNKIKIISRGNEIKVLGEPTEITRFEEKIHILMEHFHHYNTISQNDFEQLLFLEDSSTVSASALDESNLLFGNNGKLIKAKTANQLKMVQAIARRDMVIGVGPAGTGKTYTAIALAVKALKNKEVKRIILSRPAVEAGENLGFLPGDLKDKIDPYLQPLYDALDDMIPNKKLQDLMDDGIIQIAPLAYMRGRTLDNAFVILDEAQNATFNQFKMFLTRMGLHTKFIINGDTTQIDLPKKSQSGLIQALYILRNIPEIEVIHFNENDIVRHPLVKKIVLAYDSYYREKEQQTTNPEVKNND